jgi:hypothetical protein
VTKQLDRALIVETMKSNGFDRVATALEVGCHPTTVTYHMQKAALDEGKPYVSRKVKGGRARAAGGVRIKWDDASIMKLTSILSRKPLPPNSEIAFEMGVTLSALQTAMTRFNLTPHRTSARAIWTVEAISKLTSILARNPVPKGKEIAVEMGVSMRSLRRAMTEYDLTWRTSSKNVERLEYYPVPPRAAPHIRICLCCERRFGSEGVHDRLCDDCGNLDGEIETSDFQLQGFF